MGIPAVVSYESLRHMLPDSALWPQNALWGMHDFTLEGAQNGNSFNQAVEENFGKVDSLRLWLSFPLMPGEHQTVTIEVSGRDTGGEKLVLKADGLGVE